MGGVVKSIGKAVGSIFGVTQANKSAEAIAQGSQAQADAIKQQSEAQAQALKDQLAAQQRQLQEQQVAANQAIQASIDQRNLSTQLNNQMSKIKETEDSGTAPVKVDLALPTAADAADTRKKYQTGAAVGGSGGVGIRVS